MVATIGQQFIIGEVVIIYDHSAVEPYTSGGLGQQ